MTNKEAIRRILDHKRIHSLNEPRAVLINEALDLAIKALEERPQDNSICKNCFKYIDDNNYLGECVRCKYDYRNLAKLEDHFEQRGNKE